MKGLDKKRYFLTLFMILVFATIADIAKNFLPSVGLIKLLSYVRFPFLLFLILSHGVFTIGKKRAFVFFLIAFLFSLTSELLGSSYGLIFGKYAYTNQPFMFFGLIPLLTPFYWFIVIYTAFNMTNLFASFLEKGNSKTILVIFLLSTLDGLIVMNIDMISEPIYIWQGRWIWEERGPYFGIPFKNFFGWWFVTFLVSIAFRFYDRRNENEIDVNFFPLIPICIYFLIFARLFFMAFAIGHPEYALVGIASMLPVILLSMLMISSMSKK